MKKKELKILAQKIAEAQRVIDLDADPDDVKRAKAVIMELAYKVGNFDELETLDEMIQEILSK